MKESSKNNFVFNKHMQKALSYAQIAYDKNEIPIGAIITKNDQIISHGYNMVESEKNILMHAEIIAISMACKTLSTKYLSNCEIYTTLEPCGMCAYALSMVKIAKIFFGAYDSKTGSLEHGPCIYHNKFTHFIPEVYGGMMEHDCSKIINDFFIKMRSNQKQKPQTKTSC